MSEEAFLKLAEKPFVHLPAFCSLIIDYWHPEAGENASVELKHKKGEFFLDGKPLSETRYIKHSNGTEIPVATAPRWKHVAAFTIQALAEKWSAIAREYCAQQDEDFMRRVGMIHAR